MRDAHLKSRARTRTVDVLDAKPHDIVWVCAAADLPTQGGDYRVVKRDRLRQALEVPSIIPPQMRRRVVRNWFQRPRRWRGMVKRLSRWLSGAPIVQRYRMRRGRRANNADNLNWLN